MNTPAHKALRSATVQQIGLEYIGTLSITEQKIHLGQMISASRKALRRAYGKQREREQKVLDGLIQELDRLNGR